MIVDQIRIDAFIIDKLMDSPLGEKLDVAITEIERIQQLLAKVDIKKDEKVIDEVIPLIEEVRNIWNEAYILSKKNG